MKRKDINRTSEELFKRLYKNSAYEPLTWLIDAESLKRSADILLLAHNKDLEELQNAKIGDSIKPSIDHNIRLLWGLSIENLLKGIYVSLGNKIIIENELKHIKTHKILDLVEKVNIKLNHNQFELLERLEVFIEWAGRYPIPTNLDKYLPRNYDNGGWGPLSHTNSSDITPFEEVYSLLHDKLNELRFKKS